MTKNERTYYGSPVNNVKDFYNNSYFGFLADSDEEAIKIYNTFPQNLKDREPFLVCFKGKISEGLTVLLK